MDRTIAVRTPESIAFRYDLAGLGSRFLALAIDTAVQCTVFVLLFLGIAWLGAHAPNGSYPLPRGWSAMTFSTAVAIVIAILFAIFFGYFIVFEALWNGQTPGKKLLSIRVVRDGGYPLDFGGALVRNVVRIAEEAFGLYAISAVCALLSPENKRVGDYAAGTIVVRESRLAAAHALRAASRTAGNDALGDLAADERALLAQYRARSDRLAPAARARLAAQIARRIRDRVPAELRELPDDELLASLGEETPASPPR